MVLTATAVSSNNNLLQATALYQNAVECIPHLGNASSLQFSIAEGAVASSFCIDELVLLPSTLAAEGEWYPGIL